MSNREQVQKVQQQMENVLRKASEIEVSLAAAGDAEEVTFLRNQLEQLHKEKVSLREEKMFSCKLSKEVSTISLSPLASSYIASTVK